MYKFIIVDDEQIIRKGILKKIQALDLKLQFVGEAENGREAVELIRNNDPDIILTDMRMPIMDGKSLLHVLQKEYPHKKVIVISGYSDYEYMKEAISANVVDYILKPFKHEAIFKAFHKAIEMLLKEKSLLDKFELIEEKEENNIFLEDLTKLRNYVLLPYEGIPLSELKSKKLKELHRSEHLVLISLYSSKELNHSTFLEFKSDSDISQSYIDLQDGVNQNMLLFLFHFNGCTESLVLSKSKEVSEKIIERIQFQYGCKCLMGVSNIKNSLQELNHAYLETISALNGMKLNSSSLFAFPCKATVTPKELPWDKTDELLFYIENGNTAKVTELTALYFEFLAQQPQIDFLTIKFNCHNLFDKIRNMLKTHFDTVVSNSFSASYEKNISYTFDMDAIKSYFLQLLSNISNMLKQKNIYPAQEIVNNIKLYVQKNYAQNLTLEKISSLFYLNRSYCSSLFNEETGESFKEFLNRIRIERGKQLLKSTDYKITKIAKDLGYDNAKYFFRIFKKMTGFTPDEYRQME